MSAIDMKSAFEHIYSNGRWSGSSGRGSFPRYTKRYRSFLQSFLRENRVTSVLDLGCGDWQFSRLIDWTGVNYTGIDVVHSVVEANKKNYSRENITFIEQDITASSKLPPADLLIAKDVLQHWSNADILNFLPRLARFKFALITNDVDFVTRPTANDINNGEHRNLDLRTNPFNVQAVEALSYLVPGSFEMFVRRLFRRKMKQRKKLTLLVRSK